MLNRITTTKAGQCIKCQREIKPNWVAFFDDETKYLYCKPCGEKIGENSLDIAKEKTGYSEPTENNPIQLPSIYELIDCINQNRQVIIDGINMVQRGVAEDLIAELREVRVSINDLSRALTTPIKEPKKK